MGTASPEPVLRSAINDAQPEATTSTSTPPPSSRASARKGRKRRSKDKHDSATNTPKASSSRATEGTSEVGPSKISDEADDTTSSFTEKDFIPFTFSDEENQAEDEVVEVAPPPREREWDRGKGKGRERDYESARKRKVDDVDLDDGYANKKQRVNAASRRAPWAQDVDWEHCNNVAELLHREVEAFVSYISPTPVEHEVRSLVVTLLSKAVTQAFPDARVYPFGSYETKLYLPLGDIDLVIESQSMAYNNKTAVLHALANTVKKAGITDKVSIIAKAKVPIIKFVTRYGRFSVDMSINQINGVKAGQMVKRFLDEIPALRSLVLIIKSFLSQRSMNEVFTGGLGSYSIVCLAISFLQQHPKIRRGEMDPSKNLGVLVMEFFELYGCYFNYQEVGISVRDGGSYYNKAQRGWSDYRSPGLLSIEDPGDSSNDISRGSYGIAKVRTTFAGAFSIMTTKAYNQASIIASRRDRRYVRLQSRGDPEAMSILGSVMGVTQETVNQRRLVQEVYDKRILHRMLGVDPSAPISVSSSATASPERRNGAKRSREGHESVRSAWEGAEGDIEPESGDEKGTQEEEEDESRYGIDTRRQPPKKRRRTGTTQDTHIYISDDEDDDDEDVHADNAPLIVHALDDSDDEGFVADNTSEQEDAYDIDGSDDGERAQKAEKARRTRSFWLSKGISM